MVDIKESGPKVFDVAKPGDTKADIGSKPMIIGHRGLAEDPMVKKQEATEAVNDSAAPELPLPSVTKKLIAPLPEQIKGEPTTEEPATGSPDNTTELKESKVSEESAIPEELSVKEKDATEAGSTQEDKIDPTIEQLERDEKLQKMIESKKYFVTVHEAAHSSGNIFFITFFIALVAGLTVVMVLIDAGILDIGLTLPFDLL